MRLVVRKNVVLMTYDATFPFVVVFTVAEKNMNSSSLLGQFLMYCMILAHLDGDEDWGGGEC